MTLLRRNGSGRVWLIILVLTLGLAGVTYFVFQSNTDRNNTAINKETNAIQPKKDSEVKKENVATETIIKTGDSEYGSMLFDSRGQAIYIWELEESQTAECYGDCANAWPPVLTNGAPVASADINSKLLGTTKRTDGTTQVTYNGHPLYFYAHEKAGEVKCHNTRTHGGLWWVIQSNGVRAK